MCNLNAVDLSKAIGHLTTDGIYTITKKFVLSNHDLYLKTGWYGERVVLIDITIGNDSTYGSEADGLDVSRYTLSRTMIELACRDASKMLQSGVFDICDVISGWKGIDGFPNGLCPQMNGLQRGPLHCAAMIIEDRFADWSKQSLDFYLYSDGQDNGDIHD